VPLWLAADVQPPACLQPCAGVAGATCGSARPGPLCTVQKTAAPRELTAAGADGALAARSCAHLRRRRGCRASGTRRRTCAPTWCTTSRRRAGRRADSTPFDRSRQAAPARPSLRAAARAVWAARRAPRRLRCTARSAAAAPAVTDAPRAGGRRAGSRRARACGRSRAPARRGGGPPAGAGPRPARRDPFAVGAAVEARPCLSCGRAEDGSHPSTLGQASLCGGTACPGHTPNSVCLRWWNVCVHSPACRRGSRRVRAGRGGKQRTGAPGACPVPG